MAWQGFPFCDPRPVVLLCHADADWAPDKVSRRSTSGGVITLGSGNLGCWAKKQRKAKGRKARAGKDAKDIEDIGWFRHLARNVVHQLSNQVFCVIFCLYPCREQKQWRRHVGAVAKEEPTML